MLERKKTKPNANINCIKTMGRIVTAPQIIIQMNMKNKLETSSVCILGLMTRANCQYAQIEKRALVPIFPCKNVMLVYSI